ncbi:MAG: heme exporter protein CcmD [Burkholderiales bacterium]
MQWQSVPDFFAMGGHGLYVWGSYAMTAVVVAAEIWWLKRRNRTLRQGLGRNTEV